ncbi:carbohydrate ABC transporter permease [Gracilinema caldarium]|uniref:ABC-type transporter, integral membrane subunit n=1 Tax=Gracilinema caldarium (strain ATCC 51460 / DSM 7334 / H1) TaxID=744872 RepID=F8EZW5_GRAC1|nr:carbohydrate ABC transporter permease [Gracilinema caldarium]AEJ18478.1 ABC-type transporter, integral membrane subunit [Gracilinema caldarium DSM 7334]
MMKSNSSQRYLRHVIQTSFCIILSLVVLIPIYMGFVGGLKSNGQLLTDPVGLPNPPYYENYINLLNGTLGTFWRSLFNSVLVAVGTVGITLVVCVLAAFALARVRFHGRELIKNYFMLGLLFPLAVAILPLYLQVKNLNLLDNYLGVILPQVAFQIPMTVLLLRGFFLGIPQDLEDACAIDGYGPLGFLVNMIIPLSTPILATSSIIVLVSSWNNFFLPLLVFNNEIRYTLPMGVMNFQGQHAADWNMILAYLSLAIIPAILLFITSQKYIVAGLTGGAIKG